MLHFHLVFCDSRLDQMEFSWFGHQLRWHQPILHFHCFFGQPRPDHIYVRLAGASNSRWFGGKEAARSEATPWVNPSTYNACSSPEYDGDDNFIFGEVGTSQNIAIAEII